MISALCLGPSAVIWYRHVAARPRRCSTPTEQGKVKPGGGTGTCHGQGGMCAECTAVRTQHVHVHVHAHVHVHRAYTAGKTHAHGALILTLTPTLTQT